MAKHKLIKPSDKLTGKPDLTKNMTVAELKAAVKWLMEFVGLE